MTFWQALWELFKPRPKPTPIEVWCGVGVSVTSDGRYVEGATVRIGNQVSITNADGYRHFEVLKDTPYRVTVTKDGYHEYVGDYTFRGQNNITPIGLEPVAVPVPDLPTVLISGTDFVTPSGRFRYRGISAFRLAYYVSIGEITKADEFLHWASEHDVTVARNFVMAYGMFQLSPERGRDALPRLLEIAQKRCVYLENVAMADTRSYDFDRQRHIRELGLICQHPACLGLEIANEPRHPTQHDDLWEPAYLESLASQVPDDVPVALGAAHGDEDESLDFVGGDYVTVHASRTNGERGWRWVRHAREIQAQRDNHHKKPAVSDEPERADLAVDKHMAMGILMSFWGIGDTVHLASLRDTQIPTGDELAAFEARRAGWHLVGDFVGGYTRATLEDNPIKSLSDAQIVRVYGARRGDVVLNLGLGVQSEDSIEYRDNWATRTLLASVGEMRLWKHTR